MKLSDKIKLFEKLTSQAQLTPELQKMLSGLGDHSSNAPTFVQVDSKDFDQKFNTWLTTAVNAARNINPESQEDRKSVYAAMQNAAQMIDSFVNGAADKKVAMNMVGSKIQELKKQPSLSSFVPSLFQFSKALGGTGRLTSSTSSTSVTSKPTAPVHSKAPSAPAPVKKEDATTHPWQAPSAEQWQDLLSSQNKKV